MKKIFYFLTAAALVLGGCSKDDDEPVTPPTQQPGGEDNNGGNGGDDNQGEKPGETGIESLYGTYNAVYSWGFVDNSGNPDGAPTFLINPEITAGPSDNQVYISGLFPTVNPDFDCDASTPILATVNMNNKTLTINSGQVLGEDSYGTNSLVIYEYNLSTGEAYEAKSATATISDNGDINFATEYTIICNSTAGGSWYIYYTLTLQPYSGSYVHNSSYFEGTYNTSFSWYSEDINGNPLQAPTDAVNPVLSANGTYGLFMNQMYPWWTNVSINAEVLPSGDIKVDNIQMWDLGSQAYQLVLVDTSVANNWIMPDYLIGYTDEQGNISFPKNTIVAMGQYDSSYNFLALYGYMNLSLLRSEAGTKGLLIDSQMTDLNLQGQNSLNSIKKQLINKKQIKNSFKPMAK